jgi:putative ABC transport system permease protein
VGILQGTGTPTDQTLYIPLQSVQIIHQPGAHKHTHEEGVQQQQLLSTLPLNVQSAPQISAFLLGVKSKLAILTLQRNINQSTPEALSAIMPVLALRQLWQIVSGVELILKVISWLVLCTALIGMCTMLLASMQERQRELAVLRALGAKAGIIIGLLLFEALLLALVGALIGYAGITLLLMLAQPILQSEFALYISPFVDIRDAAQYILYAVLAAILLAFIPAYRAYRQSLLTGLSQH